MKPLVLLFVCYAATYTYGSPVAKEMGNDYKFVPDLKGFYKYHTTAKTWDEANVICKEEGSTLFYPTSEAERATLFAYWVAEEKISIPTQVHIGISRNTSKSDPFLTVDGTPISSHFTWCSSSRLGSDGRVCVTLHGGTLHDETCDSESYEFVCQLKILPRKMQCHKPDENTPINNKIIGYKSIPNTQAVYKFHKTAQTWQDAKKTCESEGTSLFYPENTSEKDTVMQYWSHLEGRKTVENTYIGIYKSKNGFETVDGITVPTAHHMWKPNEPNNLGSNENCAHLVYRSDKWVINDIECSNKYAFICKMPIVLPNKQKFTHPVGTGSQKFFRKDYQYIEAMESFYKIHTIPRPWLEAKHQCALEGATLFYPKNKEESNEVLSLWSKTHTFNKIFVGISDLVAKGFYETVSGDPASGVYDKYRPGEPDNISGEQDCVTLSQTDGGTLKDDSCHKKYPYVCKKTLASLKWNKLCNIPNLDYGFNEKEGRCYKFHMKPMNWTDAYRTCRAEQSYLAVINTQPEADYLVKLTQNMPKYKSRGMFSRGFVHLGFHDRYDEGRETAKGNWLEDSGYGQWVDVLADEPLQSTSQRCGAMFYDGRLVDVDCNKRSFFICEHEIDPEISC